MVLGPVAIRIALALALLTSGLPYGRAATEPAKTTGDSDQQVEGSDSKSPLESAYDHHDGYTDAPPYAPQPTCATSFAEVFTEVYPNNQEVITIIPLSKRCNKMYATRQNKCGEDCTCTKGRWVCCRVRKDFREMTESERLAYIGAVKTVSSDPTYKPEYDALIAMHKEPDGDPTASNTHHTRGEFLGWHRWYSVKMENLLRKVSPCVTLPYWPWERENGTPWNSRVWWPQDSWLGANGDDAFQCVPTGPFREDEFEITPDGQAEDNGRTCIRRRLSGSTPTSMDVYSNIYRPYHEFLLWFSNLNIDHGQLHCTIGGTMCDADIAANSPEFFLHHNNIDRIWSEWQNLTPNHKMSCSDSTASDLTEAACMDQELTGTGGLTHADVYNNDYIKYSTEPGAEVVCIKYTAPRNDYYKLLPAELRSPAYAKFWTGAFYQHVPRLHEFSNELSKEWMASVVVPLPESIEAALDEQKSTRGAQPVTSMDEAVVTGFELATEADEAWRRECTRARLADELTALQCADHATQNACEAVGACGWRKSVGPSNQNPNGTPAQCFAKGVDEIQTQAGQACCKDCDPHQKIQQDLSEARVSMLKLSASQEMGVDFDKLTREAAAFSPEKGQERVSLSDEEWRTHKWNMQLKVWALKVCFSPEKLAHVATNGGFGTLARIYFEGSTRTNSCNERCTCRNGRWHCCRVRRSILDMTASARLTYTTAVVGMSQGSGVGDAALKTDYDALIALHTTLSNIHGESQFLPWHRWYILQYENLLRRTTGGQCLTVPYWPWETKHSDPWNEVSPALWHGGSGGFGGKAVSTSTWVTNGPFKCGDWTTTPTNGNSCLRRRLSGSVPTAADMLALRQAYDHTDYHNYWDDMDGYHGTVHVRMGSFVNDWCHGGSPSGANGQMGCTNTAANAPEFFLHHANIDRQWSLWQAASPAQQAAGLNLHHALKGDSSYTVGDFLDLADHGDACVTYKRHITLIPWVKHLSKLKKAFFAPPGLFWTDVKRLTKFDVDAMAKWRASMEFGREAEGQSNAQASFDQAVRTKTAELSKKFAHIINQPVMAGVQAEPGTLAEAKHTFAKEVGVEFDSLLAAVSRVDPDVKNDLERSFYEHFYPTDLPDCENGEDVQSDHQQQLAASQNHRNATAAFVEAGFPVTDASDATDDLDSLKELVEGQSAEIEELKENLKAMKDDVTSHMEAITKMFEVIQSRPATSCTRAKKGLRP